MVRYRSGSVEIMEKSKVDESCILCNANEGECAALLKPNCKECRFYKDRREYKRIYSHDNSGHTTWVVERRC